MMTGLGWVLFLCAALVVYLFVSATIDWRIARRYEAIAHTERARTAWAEARAALLQLVIDGELEIESETFRTFYALQTFVMRRPDAYQSFSKRLAAAIVDRPARKKHAWELEVGHWPAGMHAVLAKMSEGTVMIAFGYPGGQRIVRQFLLKIMQHAAMQGGQAAWALVTALVTRVSPQIVSIQLLIAAKGKMDSIRSSLRPASPAFA